MIIINNGRTNASKNSLGHKDLMRNGMDFTLHWYWFIPFGFLIGAGVFLWLVLRSRSPQALLEWARTLFYQQRQQVETAFFQAAAASGKPRGLNWKECQWGGQIEWARDRQTGQMLALVAVTIAFEAVAGSDMEGVAAVGNLRNASAVFFFQDGQWQTAGRAIFNLNPDEVVQHYQQGYERLA
jgi:hypothetical protein